MNYKDLIWSALEGGIGAEKTASLKQRPLHEIMRQKIAEEHGIAPGPGFTLADAVGAVAVSWRKKKAAHRSIQEGIDVLKELLPASRSKTASDNQPRLYDNNASTFRKIATAYKLRKLQGHTEGETAQKIAALKQNVDEDVVRSLKKEANVLQAVAKHPVARNMGKGLAVGAGAAGPLAGGAYLAGSHLSDKFTEDARDRALQTAAGTAALGLGTYGLGRGMDHMLGEQERDAQLQRQMEMSGNMHQQRAREALLNARLQAGQPIEKRSSVSDLENFQTAIYVDDLLSTVQQTEKVAEVRQMNQEFAVDLLCKAFTE